jgi:hypothetical protein
MAGGVTRGRASHKIMVICSIARTLLQQYGKLSHAADVATN